MFVRNKTSYQAIRLWRESAQKRKEHPSQVIQLHTLLARKLRNHASSLSLTLISILHKSSHLLLPTWSKDPRSKSLTRTLARLPWRFSSDKLEQILSKSSCDFLLLGSKVIIVVLVEISQIQNVSGLALEGTFEWILFVEVVDICVAVFRPSRCVC